MVHNTRVYYAFGLCPSSGVLKYTAFRKLDLFPSSGEGFGAPMLLGPLERAIIVNGIKESSNLD
jgi:hypothetical protein